MKKRPQDFDPVPLFFRSLLGGGAPERFLREQLFVTLDLQHAKLPRIMAGDF